jgi:hypothetical protein
VTGVYDWATDVDARLDEVARELVETLTALAILERARERAERRHLRVVR